MKEELTRVLKERAVDLGFAAIGVASAQTPVPRNHLEKWLGRGYHGTMEWLELTKEKRLNPEEVLPDFKSIISVAFNYYTNPEISEAPGIGRISRYAWGDDYHEIVLSRVKELANVLSENVPGCKVKCYVDTGPVMEKFWAESAGIGWIGKHTNLINRRYGSWIFLGEILTDLELQYDTPSQNFCGSCTRCIDACPTKAIVSPYILDATRCISYLTIEHRFEISKDLQQNMGNWIYGCDICQEVCPWTRFAKETKEMALQSREGFSTPNLLEWNKITKEEFNIKFKNSPIKRAKHDGLLRNAQGAISNSG